MYGRSFEDPDGHIWEVMWMDVAAMQAAQAKAELDRAGSALVPAGGERFRGGPYNSRNVANPP